MSVIIIAVRVAAASSAATTTTSAATAATPTTATGAFQSAFAQVLVQLIVLINPAPCNDRNSPLLHIELDALAVPPGRRLLGEDAVLPHQVDVAPKCVRGAIRQGKRQHNVLVRPRVDGWRQQVLGERTTSRASLSRGRVLETSLAGLAERDPDRHVLRLAHWRPASTSVHAPAAATASSLVQGSGIVVKRLPVRHITVVVVPVLHGGTSAQLETAVTPTTISSAGKGRGEGESHTACPGSSS